MFALTIQTVDYKKEKNRKIFAPDSSNAHAYGNLWCKKVKKRSYLDDDVYPTPSEMLEGIQNWLISQAKEQLGDDKESLTKVVSLYKAATIEIIRAIDLKLLNEPVNMFKKDENDLSSPYSKITNLILYLYSDLSWVHL